MIRGVPVPNSTNHIHYLLLDRDCLGLDSYDPAHLLLRTHAEHLQLAAEVDAQPSGAARKRMAKACGIKGSSILARAPGVSFPDSFPCEFMHLVFINMVDTLLELYSIDHKGLDEGDGKYKLTIRAWAAVGKGTKLAGNTIPSSFGCRVHDIADEKEYRSAEMQSVWLMYIGPSQLKGRFRKQKYYRHFVQFVRIVENCITLDGVSRNTVASIRSEIINWVKDFESFFYQFKPERLPMCTLVVHMLLHVADSIELHGPVWVYWSFVMERHCGTLQRGIRSRCQPWASLNNFVMDEACLQGVVGLYNIGDLRAPKVTRAVPNAKKILPDYPDCELLAPRKMVELTYITRTRIVNTLAAWYSVDAAVIRPHVPHQVETWGKVRRLDGGDTMHAANLAKPTGRDMTFIRYEQMVDTLSHRPRSDPVFERRTFYGQLREIVVLPIGGRLAVGLGLNRSETLVLAMVAPCNSIVEIEGFKYYKGLTGVEITNLKTVECAIGRAPTHREGEFGIVDRSGSLSRVLFTNADDDEHVDP
ncbi:hypothetical protein BKA62DRAFT_822291 [Auriculariales sp. MPI-PUGE-AT-0066]|nr:hypothetical protein BKA62DRAFT_822291 [Auriculariales sp. MPI-PUGE-AT-0066]